MLGFGIFLLALGAIVTFAVPGLWSVPGVDWMLIGYIVMGAGLLVTIAGAVQLARGGRSRTVRSTNVDPATGQRVERVEHRDDLV
ncbi:hypothetical protein GCM10009846_07730 [Agrococcus versicolor]|uniref:DUF6458 domain-containing protein n=1 Tax=Agrococcus versicolor TaxID=501482 RepID=A0ABP5MB99_9MICO